MTITELASLGEFVSGVAVLISLIYLTVQVRQTKRNQRAMLSQGYIQNGITATAYLGDPVRAELASKVAACENSFTARELIQINSMTRIIVLRAQDAYEQFKAGLINRASYDNAQLVLQTWFAQPGYRAIWIMMRPTIAPDFRAEVDKVIVETPIAGPRDDVQRFEAALEQVMAKAAAAGAAPSPALPAG